VILITYETTEGSIRQALDAIKSDGHISDEPQMIRIEQFA
jgi:homoserine dehydrogenase